MLRNLSTGIEASATGESLNSGDVAGHPAARHRSRISIDSNMGKYRGISCTPYVVIAPIYLVPVQQY